MNSLDEIKKEISESYSWDYYKGISDNIMTLLKTYFNEREISHPEDDPYSRTEELYLHNYDYHCANFDKMIKVLKDFNYSVTDDGSWIRIDKGEFWQEPTREEILYLIGKKIDRNEDSLNKMTAYHEQQRKELYKLLIQVQ